MSCVSLSLFPQAKAWAARLKEADAPEKLPWLHVACAPAGVQSLRRQALPV
jgi:hypothetical protein